ncbi:MAG: four helix bundle protein [Chitinophagales bacterium]
MKPRHTLKKLKIWNDAIDLAVEIYKMTDTFPKEERFNLVSQMNRCVVSISSNIAEGSGRNHDKEFRHFLGIANGSANELISQLTIANRLGYVSNETYKNIEARIERNQSNIYSFASTLNKPTSQSS